MSETQYIEIIEGLGENIPLQMQRIPAGAFKVSILEGMLDPKREKKYEITVSDFFLGRYPVTQAQWRAVTALPQINQTLEPDPAYFKGDSLPVEQISWYEAVEFCARLSAHTGRFYRLPTAAEWEYACRAGTTTPFHFGKTISTKVANYKGAYNGVVDYQKWLEEDYRQTTTPVDCFQISNAFGLYDMHGNVWEWCQDCYVDRYQVSMDGDDQITEEAPRCILCGGSWAAYPRQCRASCRLERPAIECDFRNGFRVSCAEYSDRC